VPERVTGMNRSEQSAEAVVVDDDEGLNEKESETRRSLEGTGHQKPALAGPTPWSLSEARAVRCGDEVPTAGQADERSGDDDLMEQVVARDNMRAALRRVKRNQGSPGADGMSVETLTEHLKAHWVAIREQLLAGSYLPEPVRRCDIPKAGGGVRTLGIPTVLDRLIQQAILQVLQPRFDPTFSEHSYGFRPGRSAHDAVRQARAYIQAGRCIVVDVDLEKFFDRVNHDVLMGKVAKRIEDRRLLKLIRCYLEAGVLADGVVSVQQEGTPQGGPLSPLLANVLLDDVDKALERRGHAFVRYADDCNVYVRSQRAGERVLAGLRGLYAELRLRINEAKSAVAAAIGRPFLGYAFWTRKGEVRYAVAYKTLDALKTRRRRTTARNGGRSLPHVAEELRGYLPGWKVYFRLAETPGVFRSLDQWLRHRLRALQLKQWRRGRRIYRELRARGVSHDLAAQAAAGGRRWYRHSMRLINRVLPTAELIALGVPLMSH